MGARYGDYSGARMPQYGGAEYEAREPAPAHEPEDYRGHSPDAPAPLDYKYEEELAGALGAYLIVLRNSTYSVYTWSSHETTVWGSLRCYRVGNPRAITGGASVHRLR